jgi:hypothetical protein
MGRIGRSGTPRRCHCSEPLGPLCTAANWPLAQRGVEGSALLSLGDAARCDSLYMYSACHTRGCIVVMGLGLRCALVLCVIVWRWAQAQQNYNNADCTVPNPNARFYNPYNMSHTALPCDGCDPRVHPVNFTSNLNTTTDGYWCTDKKDGSPDDGENVGYWQFEKPAGGHWQCMKGGVGGTTCLCTAACLWYCDTNNGQYTGKCRCAMNGDNTQHYCFRTAVPCVACPAGKYRANCGCISDPSQPNQKWVKGCKGGECLPTPPGETATQPTPNLVVS